MVYAPTAEQFDILSESPILSNLGVTELQAIVRAATPYRVAGGSSFFHQGEPTTSVYVLVEGRVRLSQIAEDGRQVIFHYFGLGDAMGVVVALADAIYPVSAEAVTDSLALGWDRVAIVRLMEKYPRLAINGLEVVAKRFWELQNRYRELSTERVEQRLARAVLRLAAHKNGHSGSPELPTIKLSRQELAEMTGTTLFTVSRICSDWEQRGILATGREQITILDLKDLDSIAEDIPLSDS